MAQKLFSATLPKFELSIENPVLQDSLLNLRLFLKKNQLSILSWSDKYIAIPLKLAVELPPLGTFKDIEIFPTEPVLFVFSLTNYPSEAPFVLSDRFDFPKNKLAHLYIATKGRPPAFCLVRGNIDEWYANKKITDLIIRVKNWLRDAAAGELTEDGNQFEPLRLEGYIGTAIYDYDQIADIVTQNKPLIPDFNFTIGLFDSKNLEGGKSYKLVKVMTIQNLDETVKEFDEEKKKGKDEPDKRNYHYGYIIWSTEPDVFSDYVIDLPNDWSSFKSFCESYKIDWAGFEKFVASTDANVYMNFPVIVGIKRPSNLIGFSSNIEFVNFNFRVDTADVANEKIVTNVPIYFQAHLQPLTIKKATEISGNLPFEGFRSIVFGCGALGSKIIMHLGRNGYTDYVLIDPDTLSPHNLVRHALLADGEGMNKSDALKKAIDSIFPYEKLKIRSIQNIKDDVFTDQEKLTGYQWLFDFTASDNFFNTLIKAENIHVPKVCSANISDHGLLGILMFEGKDRNPRIDDLQVLLYHESIHRPFINQWLERELASNGPNNLNIQLGVGCNSETTVLADEVVSSHAAFFTGVIKQHFIKPGEDDGKIYLHQIQKENTYEIQSHFIKIPPLIVYTAVNNSKWEIRIRREIIDTMKREMGLAMPTETGGVFVGNINYKTKTIHVTDIITAPDDSKSNAVCFYRGIYGLPEKVKEINEKSGNQLGYVGEWHTHPFGPNSLSTTDMNTVKRFKKELDSLVNPLPVFLTILTPTHLLSYVY